MQVNNTIYNANKQEIKLRYPQLYSKLNHITKKDVKIEIIDSKDKNKSMIIRNKEKQVYINSKYKPLQEAEKWVDSLKIKSNSIIIVFGIGLGYRLKELASRIIDSNYLIVIEPNIQIFNEAIRHIDFSDIIEKRNICLSICEDYKDKLNIYINWKNVNNTVGFHIPNYDKFFEKEYQLFVRNFNNTIIAKKADYNTIKLSINQWTKNLLQNVPYIIESTNVKELFGVFKGKPAIIVSAGPSLNKNIKLLKETKGKAVIICVGTVLKALLKENIKPDLVITIDGLRFNWPHFKDIDYGDIPLVYKDITYSEIIENHNGKKIVFINDRIKTGTIFDNYVKDTGALNGGGSVAHGALDLAVKMGADPIVFIGQDLAYTDDKGYATGTEYENLDIDKDVEHRGRLIVEGVYGNDVVTSYVWYNFLIWFQNAIQKDKTTRKYIDATEGGARIIGTEVMTLRAVIDKYCKEEIKVKDILDGILNNKKDITAEEILLLKKDFGRVYSELGKLISDCKEGIEQSLEIIDIYETNSGENLYYINEKIKKLQTIDNNIRNKRENIGILQFISEPIVVDFYNDIIEENNYSNEIQKQIAILNKSKNFYKDIKEVIELILISHEECMESLNSRVATISWWNIELNN